MMIPTTTMEITTTQAVLAITTMTIETITTIGEQEGLMPVTETADIVACSELMQHFSTILLISFM